MLVSGLFAYPVIPWVPEFMERSKKLKYVTSGCICVPALKEYCQRMVDDEEKNILIYCKYKCAAPVRDPL